MSDYSKITNFTAKDSLTSGDPDKIVRGQLFQDEFDAISTAVNSKVELGDIQDPVIPPPPVIVIFDSPKVSRSMNSSTYTTLEPQFFTVPITPNSTNSRVKLTFQLEVFCNGRRLNNNTSGFSIDYRVVGRNKQTGQTATIITDYNIETSLRVGTGYFARATTTLPHTIECVTSGSLRVLLGDSTSGYEFEIQYKNNGPLPDNQVTPDSLVIAEEIPL